MFKHVSFDLQRGERLLVLGLNGAGKTSLLRILAGIDAPDEGEVRLGHGVQVGYAQEHEGLDPDATAMESLREVAKAPDDLLRGVLGHFLLGGDQAHQPTRTLGRREDQACPGLFGPRPPQRPAPRRAHQQPRRPGGRGGPLGPWRSTRARQ